MTALRSFLVMQGLTIRECEVTEKVVLGLTNIQVASRLFITEKTVKFHLTKIYKQLQIRSRSQLIVLCLPYLTGQAYQTPVKAPQEPIQEPVEQEETIQPLPTGQL